jgi:urease accessory protein
MRDRRKEEGEMAPLALLHLCDSLFPIGGFAYSDGLETATSDGRVATAADLAAWLDVSLDMTFGRLDGPAVWQAWAAFDAADFDALRALDDELAALRPSSSMRRSSRAMGLRLLTTWQALHPDRRLAQALALAAGHQLGPALPVAFAGACACCRVDRRRAVEAFAYTRLAATVSAAMRLMPIGQSDAHSLLARTLDRVPAAVDGLIGRGTQLESFTPAMDIVAMSQQYLHSRLFRS